MNAREIKEFRESLKTIGTKEIKAIALKILQSKGLNVKLIQLWHIGLI